MNGLEKKLAIFGLGHIGLPFAAALSHIGYEVLGVDSDRDKISSLNSGKMPFYEPGMQETLERCRDSITYTTDANFAVRNSDAIFITVGTPLNKDQQADYSSLDSCTEQIGKNLRKGQIVVLKSTVVLGTTEDYVQPKLEQYSGLKAGRDFSLAFCPERTIEGLALHELYTLPKIVGGIDQKSSEEVKKILERLGSPVSTVSSPRLAEMCKLIDNSYRTVNIALANEMGIICEQTGIDAHELVSAINRAYPRTNLFTPGLGADGPCLSKDPQMLQYSAQKFGIPTPLIDGSLRQNSSSTLRLVDIIEKFSQAHHISNLDLALIGLAFKGFPETDDLRGSPALKILESLKKRAKNITSVKVYDPLVPIFQEYPVAASIESAIKGSNAILFLTNHPKLMRLDLEDITRLTRQPSLVIDSWGNINKGKIPEHMTYFRIGQGYKTNSS